jgi:hypothetical protein
MRGQQLQNLLLGFEPRRCEQPQIVSCQHRSQQLERSQMQLPARQHLERDRELSA